MKIWKIYSGLVKKNNKNTLEKLLLKQAHVISYINKLNKQMKSDNLSILTRYGIVKERTAALMTDAIRGNLLTESGYRTQLLEFVDLSHTPKNLLIRAVKTNVSDKKKQQAMSEVQNIIKEFSVRPTLYALLYGEETGEKQL